MNPEIRLHFRMYIPDLGKLHIFAEFPLIHDNEKLRHLSKIDLQINLLLGLITVMVP